jgi:hypothetical protein
MTNQDVINACDSEKYHLVCISPEMDDFIKANYKEGNDNGKFYKVYRRGNDAMEDARMLYIGKVVDDIREVAPEIVIYNK